MRAFVGTFIIHHLIFLNDCFRKRCNVQVLQACSAFKPVYLDDQGICPKCSQRRVCSKCKCRRQPHYYTSKDAEVCYFCLLPPSNTRSSVENLFQDQPLHIDPTILDVDILIRSLQSTIADNVDRRVAEQG